MLRADGLKRVGRLHVKKAMVSCISHSPFLTSDADDVITPNTRLPIHHFESVTTLASFSLPNNPKLLICPARAALSLGCSNSAFR